MKTILTYLFLFTINVVLWSQVSDEKNNLILISTDFSSNTNTFGVTVSEIKQPNLISSISYSTSFNLDVSYMAIATANSDLDQEKSTFEHDLMVGYNINIGDNFTIYPAYTHLFHSKNSFSLKSAINDILQVDAMYFRKNYNGSLSINYLLGSKDMFYASLQNSLEIDIENFLIKESNLNIQLGFILNLSDKNYYNKIIYDSWDKLEFSAWVWNNYPRTAEIIMRSINNNGLEFTKNQVYDLLYQNKPEVFDPKYSLTSIDFYLPLFYSFKSFMFNASAYLNVPVVSNSFYEQSPSISFSAGISYFFTF